MVLPAALRLPSFRAYLAGNFFGLVGMWMLRIALGWLTWETTGSAAWTGAVAFLNFAPTFVSGPMFGVVADRMDPRRGMMTTQTAQAAFALALFGFTASGLLSLAALCAVALGSGIAASAYHPMRMTLAPRLVPREDLPQAVAMTAVNFNTTRMLGPALGGWLIAEHGAPAAVGLAACLFLPQLAALSTIPPQPPAPRDGGTGLPGLRGVLAELADGARHVARHPRIAEAVAISGLFALVGRGALELLPVAADGLFHRGAEGLGALTAAAGAGAVLASIWLARGRADLATMRRRQSLAAFSGLGFAAGLALAPGWGAALAAVAGMGLFGTVVGVSSQSITQTETPDGARGRVMSLWILVGIGGAALGAVGLGALADLIGLADALLAGAAASALALLALRLR